jgi:hypothetical protein
MAFDPLTIQISIRLRVPGKFKKSQISAALVDELIAYRLEHGKDHPRATIKIIRWQNPARKGALRNWRTGNQPDAWKSLGPALAVRGNVKITII